MSAGSADTQNRVKLYQEKIKKSDVAILKEPEEQCFSTIFDLRHNSLALGQLGVVHSYNLLKNRRHV